MTIHPFFTKAALFVKNLYMLYKKYKIPRKHTNSIKATAMKTGYSVYTIRRMINEIKEDLK